MFAPRMGPNSAPVPAADRPAREAGGRTRSRTWGLYRVRVGLYRDVAQVYVLTVDAEVFSANALLENATHAGARRA